MIDSTLKGVMGIYVLTHLKSKKKYVGSSKNLFKRLNNHIRNAPIKKKSKLYAAMRKYGVPSFSYKVVEIVEDILFLLPREQFWIERLDSHKNGYNICEKADGPYKKKITKSRRRKMSEYLLEHYQTKEGIERRNKISRALKGRSFSKEHRSKISASIKEFHWTPEGRTRIKRISLKLSKMNKGKKASAATKLKMSLIRRGRKFTQAHRLALSKAALKRYSKNA